MCRGHQDWPAAAERRWVTAWESVPPILGIVAGGTLGLGVPMQVPNPSLSLPSLYRGSLVGLETLQW